mmetsp:Transcript_9368/g.28062  ORF Transcript_9368/g.28062 Transcript_9368/m.28062 type:complete len:170 (-) Transcript_9368:21-530(-)
MRRSLVLVALFSAARSLVHTSAPLARRRLSNARRTRPVARAEEGGAEEPEEQLEARLVKTEETLAAFVAGAAMAAGAGVEILDAGAIGSALLAGAAVGFAAENENQYGFGMLARGVGKIGYQTFKAITEDKEPPVEDTTKPADFEDRIEKVRRELTEDKAAAERAAGGD